MKSKQSRHAPPARASRPTLLRRIGTALSALGLAGAMASQGCSYPDPFVDGPELYGVVVPLPPPSLSAANYVDVRVTGSLPRNVASTPLRVSLWVEGDEATSRGYFVPNDGSNFEFNDVKIKVGQSCFNTWYEGEFSEDPESSTRSYQLQLEQVPANCLPENRCSTPDAQGACLCLTEVFNGCGS